MGLCNGGGQFGRREAILCPPGGELEPVFGTDMYTDDSSICTAAVPAGLIQSAASGGIVTVEIRPDLSQYTGSTRHGITSGDWFDHWPSSFIFVWGRDLAEPWPAIEGDARLSTEAWPNSVGRVARVRCPPKFEILSVYGTDVYTIDTPVCSAAVHTGRVAQADGGIVTVKLVEGRPAYEGSFQTG